MTNQEYYETICDKAHKYDELNEWMKNNYDEYLVKAASDIKRYCSNHNSCLDCPLYKSEKGCVLFGAIPQEWEV